MTKTYPTCDQPNRNELRALGIEPRAAGSCYHNVRAVWTGERRYPQKGEWYLSGAIVGAYRAPNNLYTVYHIARLVVTETVTVIRIVR